MICAKEEEIQKLNDDVSRHIQDNEALRYENLDLKNKLKCTA